MKLEWDPDELLKAEHWNDIATQIGYDLLHNRNKYEHAYDKIHCIKTFEGKEFIPKDDFERGVLAAIGLIRQRIHSMNPS